MYSGPIKTELVMVTRARITELAIRGGRDEKELHHLLDRAIIRGQRLFIRIGVPF